MNDYFICQSCGKDTDIIAHSQQIAETPLCHVCKEWRFTDKELYPTRSDMLSIEEYHQRRYLENTKNWNRLAAGILFTDGKQILLLKRDGDCAYVDHWAIPGGKAKENESPVEVARRESKEECGFNEGLEFSRHHSHNGKNHFHTFLHSISKPFEPKLSFEHSDAKWVNLDDVDSMKLHPKFKEAWPKFLKMIRERFPEKKSFLEWFAARNP